MDHVRYLSLEHDFGPHLLVCLMPSLQCCGSKTPDISNLDPDPGPNPDRGYGMLSIFKENLKNNKEQNNFLNKFLF